MTIREYVSRIPDVKGENGTTLKDTMMDNVSIWSNDACRGYMIAAMQEAGCSRDQIQAVLSKIRNVFEELSVEGAEGLYYDFR